MKEKMPKAPQFKKDTLKRLLGYIFKSYKLQFAVVLVCIFLSSIAGVAGSLFIKVLIDDYITPLLLETNPVFDGLLRAIITMGVIFLVGIVATLIQKIIMVIISQGVLKKIRDDMFSHMQTLSIKYFDTHTHGDVMSYYTNDTDTLREMISQSIPHLFSSAITNADL